MHNCIFACYWKTTWSIAVLNLSPNYPLPFQSLPHRSWCAFSVSSLAWQTLCCVLWGDFTVLSLSLLLQHQELPSTIRAGTLGTLDLVSKGLSWLPDFRTELLISQLRNASKAPRSCCVSKYGTQHSIISILIPLANTAGTKITKVSSLPIQ